ncbi:hypothetical protein MELE44368_16245 [Mycolicibacterium elephantis DSM 44368]|uniref:PE-PPE domain-containing protein n=3 Tax=Mycolicibacterium elephantis TaxID=81858 RepID=A0A439DVU2_9MYCO|nr:hypothetical protein MELE44368_16245 [Mycolicibacterium elephantis DSM 44368]
MRLLTNALIMDGTTFPVPSQGFMDSAVRDFIAPTVPDAAGYTPIAVRQRSQIIGINGSVEGGIDLLLDAMAEQNEPFVVFGFSQSTVVTMRVKAELAERKARGEEVPEVIFVGIGVGNRPNGGIASRLAGITIPFFDFTFNGAAPTDLGFETIDIVREFDGLADTPQFLFNPVATLNAIFGVLFVHALYGPEVSLDPNSPKYVPGTVVQQYGDTTYYWIPTEDLPLFDPFRLFGVPEQVIDVFEPFFRVLVDAGYDRTIPFGEPTPAQLIPVIDPVTFAIQLAGAVVEGANNAARIFGGQLPGYELLTAQLESLEALSANVIGVPYRNAVRQLNTYFNPFQAFAAIEGPVATAFDSVLNSLGVPDLLNLIIDPVLFPLTAWAEDNLLYPRPDAPPNVLTDTLIHILRRIAPHLGVPTVQTDDLASSAAENETTRRSAGQPLRLDEDESENATPLAAETTVDDDSSIEDATAMGNEALPEDATVAEEEVDPHVEALSEDQTLAEDEVLEADGTPAEDDALSEDEETSSETEFSTTASGTDVAEKPASRTPGTADNAGTGDSAAGQGGTKSSTGTAA